MKVGIYSMHMVRSVGMNTYNRGLLQALHQLFPEIDFHLLTSLRNSYRIKDPLYLQPCFTLEGRYVHESMLGPIFRPILKRINSYALTAASRRLDVIHCTDPCHIPSAQITNLVTTIHDIIPVQSDSLGVRKDRVRAFRNSLDIAVKNSSLIVVPSRSVLKDLEGYCPGISKKVRVTYEAAAEEFCHQLVDKNVLKKYGNLVDIPYFLYVGGFNPRKNLFKLLEAFSLFPKGVRESFQLIYVGGTSQNNSIEFKKKAKELSVENQFHHLVGVGRKELVHLYNGAFALAYVSLMEGFGLPILEAMQCGCPVVTSNCSSMVEVAGDAAILVDPHDVESIRDGMIQLIEKPDLRKSLIQKGFQRAKEFSWEKTAQETYKGYQAVVQGEI